MITNYSHTSWREPSFEQTGFEEKKTVQETDLGIWSGKSSVQSVRCKTLTGADLFVVLQIAHPSSLDSW